MFYNFSNVVFNEVIATNGTNYHNPTELEMNDGLIQNSQLNSELINSFLYKCSAAIKQIQENGAVQYIPGKIYNKGNVVICNVVINNSISAYAFVCKKDNTKEAPLNGLVANDENGYTYFTSNDITENWSKIFTKNNLESSIEIDEFKSASKEVSEDNFKYIQLFDDISINNSLNNTGLSSSFRINIYRGDNFISAVVNFVYINGKCEVYVDDVVSDNYSMDSFTSIWNDNSIFKNFALLGCFLSTGTNDDNLFLCFSPRSDSNNIDNKKIKVDVKEMKGNIKYNLHIPNVNPLILDENVKKIPFVSSASSSYKSAPLLFDSYDELNYQERFKRGLLLLDVDEIDRRVYYPFRDLNTATLTNFKGKYTSTVPYGNYGFIDDLYRRKIDDLEVIEPQFCGTAAQISPESYNLNGDFRRNGADFVNGSGIWSLDNCDYYDLDRLFPNMLDTSTLLYGPNDVPQPDSRPRYFVEFDASLANSKYSDDIQNDFELDSTKIYKYVYFI